MEFRAAKNCAIRSTLTTFLVYTRPWQEVPENWTLTFFVWAH